ncbi:MULTISPECIES: response regulator transcription factor [unclassified Enterococcus]|uniref:response regulator transcription factor n=1 Tax=unclassified Enterococcus TaxID=2608891 RepID=UPI001CE070A6|nr:MULTISPECIES: response regulator transcription factor [unclassified Enterococcus]MCA5013653.1 response regulator transcription factor [Enterococcus sp. S23]MCA5016903.1 response regulator transcription factor [Enterococcus sp. S22(2020)]
MYNIGIINTGLSEEEINSYIEEGSFDSFKAFNIDPENLSNDLEEKDAVLIFTDNVDSAVTEICQIIIEIKMTSETFVWVVSQRHDEKKRVVYLQLGADGNISTECSPKELQLIVNNALNRKKMYEVQLTENEKAIEEKETVAELNEKNLSFVSLGEEVPLTRTEYKLFKLLLSNPGIAFSYEELYRKVWGKPYNNEKYRVSNVVFHIREKLEEYSLNPNHIKTVRSVGYMICE